MVTKRAQFKPHLRGFPAGLFLSGWWKKLSWRKEDGSEIIEFALSAGVFLAFVIGFMELCMVLFMVNSVAEASRQGARWASVRGTTSSVTTNGTTFCANPNISGCPAQVSGIQTYVDTLPGMSAANTTVTVDWCNADGVTSCSTSESNAAPGNIVKVKVTYKFASVPYVTKSAINLTSTAEKVIWQ